MQEVSPQTVLGDFDDAQFTQHGVTTTFSRRDGTYVVRTEGDDGELHDYDVAYVFGAVPLQQYLVAFPGGRYQCLPVAWDTRPLEAGGQRWFHVYGDQRIPAGDELFWTGRAQNWNYMCADCHSTNLQRNYDLETDTYSTTWSEIDVACEACHGPGREHVEWADARAASGVEDDPYADESEDAMGLVVRFGGAAETEWKIDDETGTAVATKKDDRELKACAPCHARRSYLRTDIVHGRALLDSYRLAGLDEGLYFADGQIRDEVYVTGSFLQSKMHAAGVSCGDCHDAHSLELRAEGNALCLRCHLDTKYDVFEHHHHELGTEGATCVACHMPQRTYMVVDPRHDHSLRVPRPDLSALTGSPNTCNWCHAEKTTAWADQEITAWLGGDAARPDHYGVAVHAGRTRGPDADALLLTLATDPDRPAMARAAAVSLLSEAPGPAGAYAAKKVAEDPDPIVRAAGMRALTHYPPQARLSAIPLLDDPVLGVRVAAARSLAAVPASELSERDLARLDVVFDEFVATELAAAEHPSAHLNLGIAYTDRGLHAEAERSYRTALRLDPAFSQAAVNLADLYRLQQRDDAAEALLREYLAKDPDEPALHHALGLTLVRRGQIDAAIEELGRAATLQPDNARYTYVHGVALESTGDVGRAIGVLEDGLSRHPNDADLLVATINVCRDSGDTDRAIEHAEHLVKLMPRSRLAQELLTGLLSTRSPR
jgi:predicted CXXCH cytochrome family protein